MQNEHTRELISAQRGCTSGVVDVPCIYMHARWELPQATRVYVVLVLRISSTN